MRHYPFHLGDYAAAARYLSLLEDLAFRRCLDLYYLDEQPLPAAAADVARAIGMRDHLAEVEAVLAAFFELVPGLGHVNRRAEAELAAYHANQAARSRAGRASADRRRGQQPPAQTPPGPPSNRPRRGRQQREEAPAEHVRNTCSTHDAQACDERATSAPQTNRYPRTNNQSNPPYPPTGGRADARGADAAQEPAAADRQKPGTIRDPSPVADLTAALMRTRYRAGIGHPLRRRVAVFERAAELVRAGMDLDQLADLVELATRTAKPRDGQPADPGRLLGCWLDEGIWREVLDEQAGKRRHAAAQRRGRAEDGAEGQPLPVAELLPELAGQVVA